MAKFVLLVLFLVVGRPLAKQHSCVGKSAGGYAGIGFSGLYVDGETSHVFDFRDGTRTCQDGQPWGLASAALGSILSWVFAFYLCRRNYSKTLPVLPDFTFYFLWRGWEQSLDTLVRYMALLGSSAAIRGMDEDSLAWCRQVGSIALIMHWWGIIACGGVQVAIALRIALKPKLAKQIVPIWLACTYISLALSVGLWYKFSSASIGIFGFIGPLAMLIACSAKGEYYGIASALVWLFMCVPVEISWLYLNNRTLIICRLIVGDCLFFLLGKKIAAMVVTSRHESRPSLGDIELAEARLFTKDSSTSAQIWASEENGMPMILEGDEVEIDCTQAPSGGEILPFSAVPSLKNEEGPDDSSLWEPLGYEELEVDPIRSKLQKSQHVESTLPVQATADHSKTPEATTPEEKMRLKMERRKVAVDEASARRKSNPDEPPVDTSILSPPNAPPDEEKSLRRASVNSFESFDMPNSEE